ncbi:NADPH-dependent F420 reductase [Haloferax namakaokahaiae]|uniref:NADPH-dependent F420 reductase n=1 Tax=Haloferax namakaokahaiae TaxID=1748331 RepID=A0ABD5ZJD1_9EURY
MKIGVVGAGRLGGTVAQLLVEAGHEVAIANRSGPQSLDDLSEMLGPRLHPAEPDTAVEFGHVVFLAIPFRNRGSLPDASLFEGKIVVDAMNPYTDDFHVIDLGEDTSSELVARQLPAARVVKAFNTMYWETIRDFGHPDLPESERFALFVAGDDDEAKGVVSDLVRELGFGPVDAGQLESGGRLMEPGGPLYSREFSTPDARDAVAKLRPLW